MPTFEASADLRLHYAGRRLHRPLAGAGDDPAPARQRRERPGLVRRGCRPWRGGFGWCGRTCAATARRRRCRAIFRGRSTSSSTTTPGSWTRSASGAFTWSGAKIGGIIARAFAARRPERVATLTVVGSPPPLRQGAEGIPALTEEFETQGRRALGPAHHGRPARRPLPRRGRRVVDHVHGPHRGVDAGRLQRRHQLFRHPGRPAEDRLPHAGHHHRRERPGLGRGDARLAADDPPLRAAGPSRATRFTSRRATPSAAPRPPSISSPGRAASEKGGPGRRAG